MNIQELQLLQSRLQTIKSEPDGIVRETMIDNLLVDIDTTPPSTAQGFLVGVDVDDTMGISDIEAAATKHVFEDNGHRWSNNDDTAGDNFGSFIAGANFARKQPGDNWVKEPKECECEFPLLKSSLSVCERCNKWICSTLPTPKQ